MIKLNFALSGDERPGSEITFELAQEEIASKAGFAINNDDQTLEAALLQKDLMEVLPGIDEANAIADELEKNVRFESLLVCPQFLGKDTDRTEVYIKLRNVSSALEFEWTKEKFLNRLYLMKEMYQNYENREDASDLPAVSLKRSYSVYQKDFSFNCRKKIHFTKIQKRKSC